MSLRLMKPWSPQKNAADIKMGATLFACRPRLRLPVEHQDLVKVSVQSGLICLHSLFATGPVGWTNFTVLFSVL